jgi:two-component sensor histidine kinase
MFYWTEKLINIGVKPNYLPWEIFLTRKLNILIYITLCNMLTAIVFFKIFDYNYIIIDVLLSAIVLFFLPIVNHIKNYKWVFYLYYFFGFIFLASMSIKIGIQSYIIMFYFPMMISLLQLLSRKETFKHLLIISIYSFFTILLVVFVYRFDLYTPYVESVNNNNLKLFIIVLCFMSTLAFNIIIVKETLAQEKLVIKMLKEKEILIAEVFHRVKNNMNIITSLLNLKKDISNSTEVKEALEDCRNRVFSMALVHQTIFNNNNITELNFKNYIEKLSKEIKHALANNRTVDINLRVDEAYLDLSIAIPCGLIINEILTNSFKYAFNEDGILKIDIILISKNNEIEITIKDNGSGLPENFKIESSSLGIGLVESLAHQIDATYNFKNNLGLIFNMKFKLKNKV